MKTTKTVVVLTVSVAVGLVYVGSRVLKAIEWENQNVEVVLKSEVKWDHLNPKRGDLAPKAGTLWGDRNAAEPTGFLLKPTDGFESPPHIHNVSYRGIVIRGVIHNDDPNAVDMWMPAGSFWTQPKGEVHITAAKGSDALAYIEIEDGPYLVLPSEDAFDRGERPVNVHKTNIVWLDASDIVWIDQDETSDVSDGPRVAFLWGSRQDGQLNGTLIGLPGGFTGSLNSRGSTFRAVVIQGQLEYQLPSETKVLESGSYFGSEKPAIHLVSSAAGQESIVYVRTDGKYDVVPGK